MNQICFEYCTRCQLKTEREENALLQELAYNEDRYLPDLLKKAREDLDSALHQEAVKQMEQRLTDSEESEDEDDDIYGMFETDTQETKSNARGIPR